MTADQARSRPVRVIETDIWLGHFRGEVAECSQDGKPFIRKQDGDADTCLVHETTARLGKAGYTRNSPELARVREWNAAASQRQHLEEAQQQAGNGSAEAQKVRDIARGNKELTLE